MKLAYVSQLSGKINEMDLPITEEEFLAWRESGQLIQDAFPQLTPSQREFLLTGSTDEEWDSAFGDDWSQT